ncbi:PAS domain-containing protein [Flavobacterium gawalongense]|uniref:PAS domain-containing protein n=2 Tax=Flavobacterium TaxID=237 RepID=A0A553BTR1_9FLAO|nr:PAS domain-containing protein [Flavobacterium gawalongense]TRX02229.1 PAS domain-containing protein [Flavobacterium gawalongense]TRX07458.1 PAS domain-containing protein [Flavobacterium gawalongense]TRX11626.1 PAS domain-containing protein [Flavobacterium gawalongense]TRX12371.1 PAS domain-containing protein [Flavobacterium gawalongense]TRX30363.1 PAS domain-containing protein [Flavobacterium gawalongense]
MNNFRQYEEAIAKYHKCLSIKTLPVFSWDFHHEFLHELKNSFLDLSKLNSIASQNKWIQNNWDLKTRIKEEVIIVTDAKLSIVFASHNMVKMNGYASAEVVGKSPKMFQGQETNLDTSNEIRKAIELKLPFEKTVLNYKKNGETYLCEIKAFPIFNAKGELSHFIAFEKAA